MPIGIGATKACLQVQQTLDDIAQGNVNALKIENFGSLQWLTSPTNTSGFEGLQNQDPGGKNRTVKVWYWQNPRTTASTSAAAICTAGTTTAQKYAEMTLSLNRSVTETLDEQQFRDFCGPDGDTIVQSPFAQQLIQGKVNQLLAAIDSDAVTYIAAHAGNFYGSIAGPKTVTMIRTDGSAFHGAETMISSDMEDAGVTGIPAAIGLGFLRTYSKTVKIACCDSSGVDLSKLATSSFVYYSDRRVGTVTGAPNRFYVLAPGACQLVTKVKWVGPYEDVRSQNEAKTTVVVPVPGGGSIPVDFAVYRSFCGSNNDGNTKFVLSWGVNFDFFSMPADDEAVGSAYRSVNGIFAYNGTCGDITCADVNS